MDEFIQWVRQALFMAILLSCLLKFIKNDKNKKYVSLVAGMIMLVTVLAPVITVLGGSGYYNSLKRYLNLSTNTGLKEEYADNDVLTQLLEEKLNNELSKLLYANGYGLKEVSYDYENGDEITVYKAVNVTVYSLSEYSIYGNTKSINTAGDISNVETVETIKILVNAGEGQSSIQAQNSIQNSIHGKDSEQDKDNTQYRTDSQNQNISHLKTIIADFYNLDEWHINVNIFKNNEEAKAKDFFENLSYDRFVRTRSNLYYMQNACADGGKKELKKYGQENKSEKNAEDVHTGGCISKAACV